MSTTHTARLHQDGTPNEDDLIETGSTKKEAREKLEQAWLEIFHGDPGFDPGALLSELRQEELDGTTHVFYSEHKEEASDLSERMAMAFFFVGTGDEDNHRMVLRWVRQDDHASIAWLILSDHTLNDDNEAWGLVQSILAGGEAG